ncbi:transaldolase family protein [Desulfovibrio sp. JC022]|uniref:transaldolase family protein n=1 Tax=Desulfovibrio sp. JC022 TaxID=2593642 RepID=UPI0013D17876|nr:transaldolase family protein [Desulfovibrio sp. JC022]NDV24526.1 hypothetical protein [Desulfovibrio sp. JC022]
MKIYLKTCSLYEVKKTVEYGLIDGICLLTEEGEEKCVAADNNSESIVSVMQGPVFVSAKGNNSDELLDDVRQLLRLSPNTVIKVQATLEGFKVCKILAGKDVSVNVCGLDSITKAIMAAKSGAEFVSFNLSAVQQKSSNNFKVLADTVKLFHEQKLQTNVLADLSDESIDIDQIVATGIDGLEISFKGLMDFMGNDS